MPFKSDQQRKLFYAVASGSTKKPDLKKKTALKFIADAGMPKPKEKK